MEESRKIREETKRGRAEAGAEDVRPGEVEGMHPSEEASTATTKSRAMEKRKRELEERRKVLEAKRRKVGGKEDAFASKPSPAPESGRSTPAAVTTLASDPFAALEAQSGNAKGKRKMAEPAFNAADAFLAQLEQDIVKGKPS